MASSRVADRARVSWLKDFPAGEGAGDCQPPNRSAVTSTLARPTRLGRTAGGAASSRQRLMGRPPARYLNAVDLATKRRPPDPKVCSWLAVSEFFTPSFAG